MQNQPIPNNNDSSNMSDKNKDRESDDDFTCEGCFQTFWYEKDLVAHRTNGCTIGYLANKKERAKQNAKAKREKAAKELAEMKNAVQNENLLPVFPVSPQNSMAAAGLASPYLTQWNNGQARTKMRNNIWIQKMEWNKQMEAMRQSGIQTNILSPQGVLPTGRRGGVSQDVIDSLVEDLPGPGSANKLGTLPNRPLALKESSEEGVEILQTKQPLTVGKTVSVTDLKRGNLKLQAELSSIRMQLDSSKLTTHRLNQEMEEAVRTIADLNKNMDNTTKECLGLLDELEKKDKLIKSKDKEIKELKDENARLTKLLNGSDGVNEAIINGGSNLNEAGSKTSTNSNQVSLDKYNKLKEEVELLKTRFQTISKRRHSSEESNQAKKKRKEIKSKIESDDKKDDIKEIVAITNKDIMVEGVVEKETKPDDPELKNAPPLCTDAENSSVLQSEYTSVDGNDALDENIPKDITMEDSTIDTSDHKNSSENKDDMDDDVTMASPETLTSGEIAEETETIVHQDYSPISAVDETKAVQVSEPNDVSVTDIGSIDEHNAKEGIGVTFDNEQNISEDSQDHSNDIEGNPEDIISNSALDKENVHEIKASDHEIDNPTLSNIEETDSMAVLDQEHTSITENEVDDTNNCKEVTEGILEIEPSNDTDMLERGEDTAYTVALDSSNLEAEMAILKGIKSSIHELNSTVPSNLNSKSLEQLEQTHSSYTEINVMEKVATESNGDVLEETITANIETECNPVSEQSTSDFVENEATQIDEAKEMLDLNLDINITRYSCSLESKGDTADNTMADGISTTECETNGIQSDNLISSITEEASDVASVLEDATIIDKDAFIEDESKEGCTEENTNDLDNLISPSKQITGAQISELEDDSVLENDITDENGSKVSLNSEYSFPTKEDNNEDDAMASAEAETAGEISNEFETIENELESLISSHVESTNSLLSESKDPSIEGSNVIDDETDEIMKYAYSFVNKDDGTENDTMISQELTVPGEIPKELETIGIELDNLLSSNLETIGSPNAKLKNSLMEGKDSTGEQESKELLDWNLDIDLTRYSYSFENQDDIKGNVTPSKKEPDAESENPMQAETTGLDLDASVSSTDGMDSAQLLEYLSNKYDDLNNNILSNDESNIQ